MPRFKVKPATLEADNNYPRKTIGAVLSLDQYSKLIESCKKLNITVSEYVRQCVLNALKEEEK
jgi:hypothetical protein